jgi:alkanesulfonate monooxygenase SsuD/methylene tetrahydromethanopterin reductase-like flavin-dependent oxidoreductase (luciferase family)
MTDVALGVVFPMTLLREYTVAVRDLLHGRTVDVDGRYVHLKNVSLDWSPAEVPPLMIGGWGSKTVRLAGEVADGVIFSARIMGERLRESCGLAAEGHAAAGRTGEPFDNVVFVELDPAAANLAAQIDETIAALAGMGVTTVVFQAPGDAPDPEPLIAACARR